MSKMGKQLYILMYTMHQGEHLKSPSVLYIFNRERVEIANCVISEYRRPERIQLAPSRCKEAYVASQVHRIETHKHPQGIL